MFAELALDGGPALHLGIGILAAKFLREVISDLTEAGPRGGAPVVLTT